MPIPIENRSCYDVIEDLDSATQDLLMPHQQYYVLGGIATAAINHPDSIFDHQTERVVAASESGEPVLRKNGTQRDIDILVLDILTSEQAQKISQGVSAAIKNTLVVSVFGLDGHRVPTVANRVSQLLTAWTSQRTVDDNNTLRYELYPLTQEVPRDSFTPWTLELPAGSEVRILNPAAHMLAYYMRSISGLRAKDRDKVTVMRERITSDPNFEQQIQEGSLQSWRQFATGINQLRNKESDSTLPVNPQANEFELMVFRLKSKLLQVFEANDVVVKYAQKGLLQKLLKPFVGAH